MPADGVLSAHNARLAKLVRLRSGATYSLAEVSAHNTPADCWLIIRGKVYDVTPWCAILARAALARAWRARAARRGAAARPPAGV
jgi:hypothetical protein